jgi:hypothetical protein
MPPLASEGRQRYSVYLQALKKIHFKLSNISIYQHIRKKLKIFYGDMETLCPLHVNRTASGDLANEWRYSIKESRNILRNHRKNILVMEKYLQNMCLELF